MKRWQSKNEKLLIGGLFLLLVASSFPWTNVTDLELGSANLSAMKKPEGITIDENDDIFEAVDKSKNEDSSESDSKSSKKKVRAKKKVSKEDYLAEDESEESEESDDSSIHRKFEVGDKVLEATYETSEKDDSQTLVTLSPRNETEAQDCMECITYKVNHPLDGGEISNIRTINLAIKDAIKTAKKKKARVKLVTVSKYHKLADLDDENDDETSEHEEDPIKKACKSKKGKDSYTLCAMKELGRIANITGDDAYDASEIQDLFEKHIFNNLQNQLKDKNNASRQDDAKIAISNLIEKLDDSNSDELRTGLTKLKLIPLVIEAQQLALKERESKALAKSNPVRALRVLNEFNMRRYNFERTLSEDMYDTALTYENLIGDNFSRDRAMLQFQDNFVDPINQYRDALWSSDPFNSMRNLQTQANMGSVGNPALRGARDQMGRGGFPSRGGLNNRSLPPRAGTNSRFVGPGQNGRFVPSNNPNGYQSRFANNGISSRFSAPTTNSIYNNMGYGPNRYGAPNVLAPYKQSAINYGRPYGPSSPGYMGYGGPGIRTPVLNGANYYSGYSYPYSDPFAYRPGINGAFSYAPNGAYPQAGMPYGAPGMSAARPRF